MLMNRAVVRQSVSNGHPDPDCNNFIEVLQQLKNFRIPELDETSVSLLLKSLDRKLWN